MTDNTKHIATPSSYTPRLRQKKRSYAESGLETLTSAIKTNSGSKRLVYMQDVNTEPQEKQLDLYEFDSDSEGIRGTRKKRVKRNWAKKTPTRSAGPKSIAKKVFAEPEVGQSKNIAEVANKEVIAMMEGTKSTENIDNVNPGQNDGNIFFGFDDTHMAKVTIVKLKPNEELNLSVVSTTITQKDCPLTPWRFTGWNVTRNPHLIQLKESSLPRLDQEMVLDYSVVEHFENSTKITTPSAKKPRQKKRSQRNITDYFDSNSAIHHQHEISLFEGGCFSPSEDETDDAFLVSTPRHRFRDDNDYEDGEEERDDELKLSVSVKDKKYSHKPKLKKVEDKNTCFFETETLTPKIKRGGNINNPNRRKVKSGKIGKEEEDTELLFANLSLEYEKIENFPLLIDD